MVGLTLSSGSVRIVAEGAITRSIIRVAFVGSSGSKISRCFRMKCLVMPEFMHSGGGKVGAWFSSRMFRNANTNSGVKTGE